MSVDATVGEAESGRRLRALVVEDQTVFREMLVELLELTDEVDVIAQPSRAADAIRTLEEERPDVAMVDLILPDGSGLDVIDAAHRLKPRTAVLVLTGRESPSVMSELLRKRPLGIVTKTASLDVLREAIRKVCSGQGYYCGTTLRLLQEAPEDAERLSDREREVVMLVAKGLSSKEIADVLSLSVKTVSNHRLRIGKKLGYQDIAGWTRFAVAHGWVSEED